jgi:hypothetical protein
MRPFDGQLEAFHAFHKGSFVQRLPLRAAGEGFANCGAHPKPSLLGLGLRHCGLLSSQSKAGHVR